MRRFSLLCAVLLVTGCTGDNESPAPAPVTTAATTPAVAEADLLARPLRVPTIAKGEVCPVSTPRPHSPVAQPADEMGLGAAPLYPISFYIGADATLHLGPETPAPDGLYEIKVVWASTTGYEGPAVVRIGRLDGPGRGHVRLYYEESATRGEAVVFRLTGTPTDWPSGTYVSGPGCYAYQIDGATFSELVVFAVVK